MKLHKITDPEFARYGRRLEGYDLTELLAALSEKKIPETGIVYEASDKALESSSVFAEISDRGFGGMPVQIGYVSADNCILDCLEYHKSSEFNIAFDDMILILGLKSDITDGSMTFLGVRRSSYLPERALSCLRLLSTTRRLRRPMADIVSLACSLAGRTSRLRRQSEKQPTTNGCMAETNG